MKKYRAYSLNPRHHIADDVPHHYPDAIARYEDTDPIPEMIVRLGAVSYSLLLERPDTDSVVLGAMHCDGTRRSPDGVLCQGAHQYPYYRRSGGKCVGYLPLQQHNHYLEVTSGYPLLLWLPMVAAIILLCTLLITGIRMVGVPVVVYSNDPVSSGAITPSQQEPLEADYFNIKINATPILADGQMNLRVENSERNIYSCHVEVMVGEQTIYTSPVLEPNQHIEHATVTKNIATGTYGGVATFYYYSGDKLLQTTSSVQLILSVR